MQTQQDRQIQAFTDAVYVWDIDKADRLVQSMDIDTQNELIRRGYGAAWVLAQGARLGPDDPSIEEIDIELGIAHRDGRAIL